MSHHEMLVELLARYSFREGTVKLSSGKTSEYYVDAKQVTYSPSGMQLVGEAVLDLIERYNVQAVGGLTMGADAIVASVVCASQFAGRPVSGFVVRKLPKEHGLEKHIEGVSPQSKRVAIVDDVVTSGSSILKAVEMARSGGAEVVVLVSLVDREEPGGSQQLPEITGAPFHAICTLSEIREAAVRSRQTVAA